ncbi:aminotransferase class I/II-fold pyridoxal phosphate-dependent enzyme [Saccharopolyspora sp. WRP15-2]|uniref:cysteine-S-conjugate beta-lyase n=1 Tax=Saccharopolyspora oryzae TaxID=2997343 RepID=A0ABT4V628_9PSEU|nr:aminotransferase class I/II-fold pyridoxal phosphate-dependent enzyme [Saccharopolyspora oryzae]MDA3629393.1 aminotransferase class I/II-fold pyridoxal phosphate-dependent enzyme [Saccharopolyspora oryzae]
MTSLDSQPVWRVSGTGKRWSTHGPGVLDLGVAEMDLSACPPVFDAVRKAVSAEAFGYPAPDARSGVPEATSRWLSGFGLAVPAGAVRLVADVLRGIAVAIRNLTRPGSAVIVPTPTYQRFIEVVPLTGRETIEIPLIGGRELDLEAIERALAAGAGSVLLCHPVNPTGAVFGADQLADLAELVQRWGGRVISDEVHAPIRYGVPFTPYASLNDAARAHAVTVTSATKAWNFPGLRTAMVALTNPEDVEVWNGLRHLETSGVAPLGMVATVAAFEHGQPWLEAVLADLDARRNQVVGTLADAGLGEIAHLPDATYLAWLDLRAWDENAPAERLRKTAGVALGEGALYGAAGTGFARLNFATTPDVLAEALDRIVHTLTTSGLG